MSWVQYVVNHLRPSFGGFPTFCEDPDKLLQQPEVQAALESSGMTLHYWDGNPDSLKDWAYVQPEDKPLVIVEPDFPRHLIESSLKNHLLQTISVGEIFSKFHTNVVKELPMKYWDKLFELHQTERPHRTAGETAILIGRAFYGVDPLFLNFGQGWPELLTGIAESGHALPMTAAHAILEIVKVPSYLSEQEVLEVLTDPVVTRAIVKNLINSNKQFSEAASQSARVTLPKIAELKVRGYRPSQTIDWLGKWETECKSPRDVLKFALEYGRAASEGDVSSEERLDLNRQFLGWLRENYIYAMTSTSPDVFKLHTLVKQIDEQTGAEPLLFVVVDALGIEGWFALESVWQERIGFQKATARAAFAILPTMTILSRRAIFEGKMPSHFGQGDHSQALEQHAWRNRFGDDGGYFTLSDRIKLDDAFARQLKRTVVVDTQWDLTGHSIFPESDSIISAVRRWGKASPLAEIVKSGLDHGYKVVITSDHGQIACTGIGRPNIGSLSDQRLKRVMLFKNEALLKSYTSFGNADFQPYGMPNNQRALFARDLESFDLKGVQGVSHGGASIEETIVPVIEVVR